GTISALKAFVPTPPANAAADPDLILASSSCPKGGSCVAVGQYHTKAGGIAGLIATLSNGSWTFTEAPFPSNADRVDELLDAVSCPAVGWCAAFGEYTVGGANRLVIEMLSRGKWTALQAPMPSDAATNVQGTTAFDYSIACLSTKSCEAFGFYWPTSESAPAGVLADTYAKGHWKAAQVPMPPNAIKGPQGLLNLSLLGFACSASGSCAALGMYLATGEGLDTFLDAQAGSRWTSIEAPGPSASTSYGLSSLACWAGGSCAAVGWYEKSSDEELGLIDTLTDDKWTPGSPPAPSDMSPQGGFALQYIACPTATYCAAVGIYDSEFGGSYPIEETRDGGSWQPSQPPLPASAEPDSVTYLYGFGCAAAGECAAIGSYLSSEGDEGGDFAATSYGTDWQSGEFSVPAEVIGTSISTIASGGGGFWALGECTTSSQDDEGLIVKVAVIGED
ncbi:MAG TPA: hypothetical protein VGP46_07585, partial [Acidimicrobiales bacterium]|nr:hypothetical protein [Acidimicrobiales bacterium]